MLLRSTLEKHVPLKEGEQHLSPEAQSKVFRGNYGPLSQDIVKVESVRNRYQRSSTAYPYGLEITRKYFDNTLHFTGDSYDSTYYSNPTTTVAEEMREPGKLQRANRIERIGRRLKASVVGLAVIGVIGLGILTNHDENVGQTAPEIGLEKCENIVTGGESLIPIDTPAAIQLQKTGQTVCALAGHDYLVTSTGANG